MMLLTILQVWLLLQSLQEISRIVGFNVLQEAPQSPWEVRRGVWTGFYRRTSKKRQLRWAVLLPWVIYFWVCGYRNLCRTCSFYVLVSLIVVFCKEQKGTDGARNLRCGYLSSLASFSPTISVYSPQIRPIHQPASRIFNLLWYLVSFS